MSVFFRLVVGAELHFGGSGKKVACRHVYAVSSAIALRELHHPVDVGEQIQSARVVRVQLRRRIFRL